MVDTLSVVTHEDYLVAVTTVVCEQYPSTAAALSEVQLVFGTGPRRRALDPLHRAWGGGEANEALPLVEIAAIGGLERRAAVAETMRARRASVQADRRIAGAILRGAGGSRAMAAARARHQAEARRDEAEHLAAPTGFESGYAGSGPAQLALALLLDTTGEPRPGAALVSGLQGRPRGPVVRYGVGAGSRRGAPTRPEPGRERPTSAVGVCAVCRSSCGRRAVPSGRSPAEPGRPAGAAPMSGELIAILAVGAAVL